jgi:hypothetical protein
MNSLGVCIALFPLRQLNIWPLTSNEILLSAFGWRKGIFARSGTINCAGQRPVARYRGMNALSHSSIDRIVFQQALFQKPNHVLTDLRHSAVLERSAETLCSSQGNSEPTLDRVGPKSTARHSDRCAAHRRNWQFGLQM